MKKLYIDPGSFYTKVNVVEITDGACKYYGRNSFPSVVETVEKPADKIIYYRYEDRLYCVGYDCSFLGRDLVVGTDKELFRSDSRERIILNKIIWDYSNADDELELNIVVDNPVSRAVFENIKCQILQSTNGQKLCVKGFRGCDKCEIQREAKISVNLMTPNDGICDFVSRMKKDFRQALVVDMGYHSTKVYIVGAETGAESFQTYDFGIKIYYETLLKLIDEEKIPVSSPVWMIKQIESGFQKVEVNDQNDVFDISAVLENVRWDLNKDFRTIIWDLIRGYYTNTTKWVDMLIVIGGGAPLNGDILCRSLQDDGFTFKGVYVENLPLYTLVMGAMRDHVGDQASAALEYAV